MCPGMADERIKVLLPSLFQVLGDDIGLIEIWHIYEVKHEGSIIFVTVPSSYDPWDSYS